ncbi:CLIP-associating protein 1 [Camelus dromedarius]|uniref:CLIP-associating protein 1 n=1 Tax=Camelus dromedarius TaxID=9838 RepID=A0A5N4E642_CAMDR|nr:CLIP-associating protein 1 [Camelus dromedarius]
MGTARRVSSSTVGSKSAAAKEGAGAVDEEDFIKAFDDVPVVQLKKIRSLLLAGAADYDNFFQHLRLLDGAFKLSAKDLRSQVVREACITLGHLSSVLRNKFDHGAEAIMPTIFNLIPNSAKVMATSGVVAIRLIIRAAFRCYWGFHSHFSREAEHLYHSLESSYQKALQSHLKNSDSIVSLPQSDLSSSSSQESLNRPLSAKRSPTGSATSRGSTVSTKSASTTGSLQRSRSDIDVNAAASAKSKVSSSPGSAPFSSAAALPPGSYASLESRAMRGDAESAGPDSDGTTTKAEGKRFVSVIEVCLSPSSVLTPVVLLGGVPA